MSRIALALAMLAPVARAAFAPIASFVPGSDVTEHAKIDMDIKEMIDALQDLNYIEAWEKYAEGGNSEKGSGTRTVRGFSKDLPDEPIYEVFKTYFGGNEYYADDYIRGALWDKLPADSSAKERERPEFFKTATLSDAAIEQIVKKGAVYMNTWIYSLHELYSAVKKCKAGNVDLAGGAPHAWDEYWAFYAGSLAGADGKDSGQLSYALADKRQGNFGTGIENQDPLPSWRAEDDGANSNVNAALLWMTRAGWVNVKNGDCDAAEEKIPMIINQMTVPLVQGTLRYAWKSDPNGNNEVFKEAGQASGKPLAELNAFGYSIVARVAACADGGPAAAETIAKNIAYPDMLAPGMESEVVPDGFAAVKAAFEEHYECLGITCSDVGGLLDSNGDYVVGMEPCNDGSTVDDMAETIDKLKVEFEDKGDESDGAAKTTALAGIAAAALAVLGL